MTHLQMYRQLREAKIRRLKKSDECRCEANATAIMIIIFAACGIMILGDILK